MSGVYIIYLRPELSVLKKLYIYIKLERVMGWVTDRVDHHPNPTQSITR